MNKQQPMQNNLSSYLTEIEEMFKAEFGTDIPERRTLHSLSDEEVMIIFFALKQHLANGVVQGVGAQVIVKTTKLIEELMPVVQEATKFRIDFMNKTQPSES